jgi:hypothetical protein
MLSSFKADLNLREASAYAKFGAYEEELKLLFHSEITEYNQFNISKCNHCIENIGGK